MLLQFCALGVTMSWDDGFPGARASRPHQAWHSLGHLPHLDRPGTEPWLSFGLADAVPAHRVAACSIALKLSGGQRDRMRAGRPRSQGNHSPLEGESQKPSRQAKADAVGGGRRATSQNADVHPLGDSRLPASPAPALPCGSFQEKRPIANEDEPRMDTKEHEETWTSFNHKRHQNAFAIWCPWCDFVSLALFHGLTPTAPCGRRIRGLIRTPGLAPEDYLFENRSPHAMSGLLESGSAVVGVAHPTKCLLQDFLPVKGIRPVAG